MRRWIAAATAGAALVVGTGALVLAAPVAAYAEVDPDTDQCVDFNDLGTVPDQPPDAASEPLDALQIQEAQGIAQRLGGKVPGTGVKVAVIDSGVYNDNIPGTGVPFQAPSDLSAGPTPTFYHGTAMAGIIAGAEQPGVGPVGIAPGAKIFDVRVYDTEVAQDELRAPTEASVIAGLNAVEPYAGTDPGDIRIVNLSLAVKDVTDDALLRAVRAVTDKGAIVVTSTGNRGGTDEDEAASDYDFGEDAADTLFPAAYARGDRVPLVVAVGTTTAPEEGADTPAGLLSSAIDVVVPTYGAVSYTITGSTCVFAGSSTSVAAAEVSGILAMMMTAFPRDTARELIARLEVTATGGSSPEQGAPDKYVGRGIVQPIDALTRPLPPNPDGVVDDGGGTEPRATPAALPRPEPDVLQGTRRNATWWGLFGGGALVVAMLLRPVLSRRRRARVT